MSAPATRIEFQGPGADGGRAEAAGPPSSRVVYERRLPVTDERLQILRMVEQGKISADEAAKLLEALGGDKSADDAPRLRRSNRVIRIRVVEGERTKVNVNFPLELARVALSFIPKETLRAKIGGEALDVDEIIRLLEEGLEGKVVDVDDGETKVEVVVE